MKATLNFENWVPFYHLFLPNLGGDGGLKNMLSKIYHTCDQFAEASQLCNPDVEAKQTGLNLLAARTFAKAWRVLLLYKILSITTLAQNCFIDIFFYLFSLDILRPILVTLFFLKRSYKTWSNHPYHHHLLRGSTPSPPVLIAGPSAQALHAQIWPSSRQCMHPQSHQL